MLGGPLDEDVRVRGAVPQRVAGRDVQVDEGVHGAGRGPSAGGEQELVPVEAERRLDDGEERLGVAEQVVGLAGGDDPGRPASAAARLRAPAAKNAAHSASSGATAASSTQALVGRDRRGGVDVSDRARQASTAAAARRAARWAVA